MLRARCLNLFRIWKMGLLPNAAFKSFHCTPALCMEDYYKTLGVSRNATAKEIKKAYFSLAKKYHPDSNPGSKDAACKFQQISQAYEILGNKDKKQNYDTFGSNPHSQSSQGFNNAYGNPFGNQQAQWTYHQVDPKEAEELFKRVFKDFNKHGSGTGGNSFFNSMMSKVLHGVGNRVMEEMMKPGAGQEFEIKMGPKGIEFVKKSKKK